MTIRQAFVGACVVLPVALAACGGRTPLFDTEAANSFDAAARADAGVAVDASVPTAPRLIAPLSTSRVTSRQPTLRWELPDGVADATVDLCSDRACTYRIGTPLHVTGTSTRPPSDLPVGVVYWRLHPSTSTSITSPTWQFNVGARSAPIDTSWGTTLDVNGDGYADIAVAAPFSDDGAGNVYVYFGNSHADLGLTPATTLTGTKEPNQEGEAFGYSIASAGDVNGDGIADLIVGTGFEGGHVYLYLGNAAGLVTTPTILAAPEVGGGLGPVELGPVASAGDINGDGYADLIVGAPALSAYAGAIYLYFGGADGPTAPITLPSPDGTLIYFGSPVAGVGDVNGDGYADVVAGAWDGSNGTARAYLYFGSASGLVAAPVMLIGRDGDHSTISVATAGDVNGDGYADLVIGAGAGGVGSGHAYVYLGSVIGLDTTPSTVLTSDYAPDAGISSVESFGISVACAGDVNGDGYEDLLVGAPSYGPDWGEGGAQLYLGGASSLTPITMLMGSLEWGDFGDSVASAGDMNGDGYADLVVGANMTGDSLVGAAYVFFTPLSPPATGLVLPAPDSSFGAEFGYSVCGATN